MNSLEIAPGVTITNDRCLILEDGPTAVLGDLHLGYEKALEEEGMYIPRINTGSIRDSLNRILSKYEPERVVLLGDIKHDFRRSKFEARREVTTVVNLLSEAAETIIVRGNHDNFLQNTLSELGMMAVDYVDIGGYRLEHGHRDSGKRPVIIGHEHPSVRIPGAVSGGLKMQCFVYAEKEGVIVLPPFSPFSSGNDLSLESGCVMADALKKCDLDSLKIIGVSEVGLMNLGTLKDVLNLDI
jgi:putative SbcD/Mre11-related phosphoesterase